MLHNMPAGVGVTDGNGPYAMQDVQQFQHFKACVGICTAHIFSNRSDRFHCHG
jgi:hypothetical protein